MKHYAIKNLYKLEPCSVTLVSSKGVSDLSERMSSILESLIKSIFRSSFILAQFLGLTTIALVMKSFRFSETLYQTYSLKSKNSSCRLSLTPPVISKYKMTPMDQTSLLGSYLFLQHSGARKILSTPETKLRSPWF